MTEVGRQRAKPRKTEIEVVVPLFFISGKDEDNTREEGVMKEKSKGVKESKKAPQKSLKEKRKMKKEKKNR